MSKRLLVVWWTMTGGTRQLVDAFRDGAGAQEGVELVVRRADEAQPSDLLAADAVLFATPENLASMAGMMKDFFARIATGWRMKPVAEPLVVITHAQTPEAILAPKSIDAASLDRARELGAAMAAGVSMGIW